MDISEKEAFLAYSRLPCHQKRVARSLEIIREALATIAPAAVSVSWGKDSTAMLHLIQQLEPDIPAFFFGDELEDLQNNYSEVSSAYCERYPTRYTKILYDELAKPSGPATKLSLDHPMIFIGCRYQESRHRRIAISKYGVIHQWRSGDRSGAWRCFPLAWWETKDVWAYTVANELPYLKSYDLWGYDSRTAVINNFNLHKNKHQEFVVQSGAFSRLKIQSPEYYRLYVDLYPGVVCF